MSFLFGTRGSIPKAPKEGSPHNEWSRYFNKYLDALFYHYDRITKKDRNFTLVHPEDIWKIAEYWHETKPNWVNILSNRYPEDAFNFLWENYEFSSNGEKRQFWMMFLSLGFHAKKGPLPEEIIEYDKLPFGLPEDTPVISYLRDFRYPKGIINPRNTEDIKYVWRAISLAKELNRYRKEQKKSLGPKSGIIAYHTGLNVAAQYDAMLPSILFTSDTPGMPGELSGFLSREGIPPMTPEYQSSQKELQHEEERVEKAVRAAVDFERATSQKEIEEYKRSLEKLTQQLDEQNNELRMAKVTTSQLAAKVADLIARLRECEEEAKERGDPDAEREAEENTEQANRVYSDVTALASSIGRATEDNTKAIQSTEGLERRGSAVAQETKAALLKQIEQGYQLRKTQAKTPEQKREVEEERSLLGALQRAVAQRRVGIQDTPVDLSPSMPSEDSAWRQDLWRGAGIGLSLGKYYRTGDRGRRGIITYESTHFDTYESVLHM